MDFVWLHNVVIHSWMLNFAFTFKQCLQIFCWQVFNDVTTSRTERILIPIFLSFRFLCHLSSFSFIIIIITTILINMWSLVTMCSSTSMMVVILPFVGILCEHSFNVFYVHALSWLLFQYAVGKFTLFSFKKGTYIYFLNYYINIIFSFFEKHKFVWNSYVKISEINNATKIFFPQTKSCKTNTHDYWKMKIKLVLGRRHFQV